MPSTVTLGSPDTLGDIETLVIVGRQARLLGADVRPHVGMIAPAIWEDMVRRGDPGDAGRIAVTHTGLPSPRKVVVAVLPEVCGRHNTPSRATSIPALVRSAGATGPVGVLVALDDPAHAVAAATGIARGFSTFSAASRQSERAVRVAFLAWEGPIDLAAVQEVVDGVRLASRWVDVPPNEMHPASLVATATAIAAELGVRATVIAGEDLREQGLGGLYNVGKASVHPPALVVLDWDVADSPERVVWVGKGVCYDTGGLSIKGKFDMPGMKTDMGGAAAVLAAFRAAVRMGTKRSLTAILCIAENSVGANAMRPDDVITLYSGRTIEVNNTDAEGRLILADGLGWAVKHRAPTELVDLATLTGAQSVATGKRIAAIYATDEDLERRAVVAGRASGDLVHPLPFVPEFWRPEFGSAIADLKNSVKDRGNGQSACAAQFLVENLGSYSGPFMHVDIAAPAVGPNGRGTGFGVPLLLELLRR